MNSLQQLRLVKRYLQKINGEIDEAGNAYYFDDMHSFFIHCYHLKDYIKNELVELKSPVEKLVKEKIEFRICDAICQKAKHFVTTNPKLLDADLKNPRSEFIVGVRDIDRDGPVPHKMDIEYLVEGDNGEYKISYGALELATKLVELWDEFFTRNGLRNI